MKFVMSIVETLSKCSSVLQMLLENNSDKEKYVGENDSFDKTLKSNDDDQDSEKKKQKLLTLLEERLQHILKCMIKMAMIKTSKLVLHIK